MEFALPVNATLMGPDVSHSPFIAAYLISDQFQSPVTLGITTSLAALVSFLAYQIYRPPVHKQSPAFISDTLPILGSFGFITRHWSFWQGALKESKTGNFSFWLGKKHVVGVSGTAARKMFYEHPNLDLVTAQILLCFGTHFWPPIHDIFSPTGNRIRNNTHFLRTLLGFMKTAKLERCLLSLIKDARTEYEELLPNNPSGVVNSPELWRTIFRQNARLFLADDIANDPKLFARACSHLDVILHTFTPFYALCHWLPEPGMIRRRFARRGMQRITRELYNSRKKYGTIYKDDPLQTMIDNGDSEDYITEFCTSAAFITTTNAHIIVAQMVNTMAIHTDWQEKVYREIVAAANRHSKDKDALLVDKLSSIPLTTWETAFPSMELCLEEVVRVWTSFASGRYNASPEPIPIPGSNEVIPGNTFAVYNSTELNFNEKLYPRPTKFDPMRFTEGRQEYKQEPHGFFGWGTGVHPCAGMRWAKLQQFIIVAHALALYKWTSCEADGKPDPYAAQRQGLDADLDSDKPFALPPAYCKMEPREKA